jgi:hypothetical protein
MFKIIKRTYYFVMILGILSFVFSSNIQNKVKGTQFEGLFSKFEEFSPSRKLSEMVSAQKNQMKALESEMQDKLESKIHNEDFKSVEIRQDVEPSVAKNQLVPEVKEKVSNTSGAGFEAVLNPNTGTYIINDKHYVYFKEAYRPYNPKNIYHIGGVYYSYKPQPSSGNSNFPGSNQESSFKGERVNIDANVNTRSTDSVGKPLRKSASDTSPNGLHHKFESNPQPGGAYNINNVKEVMDNLKNVQKNVELRNKQLKQIVED